MSKTWSNRFEGGLDQFIHKFNSSIDFDKKLILEDIDCSIAHARMLSKTKVINDDDSLKIINGLKQIKNDFQNQLFDPSYPSEDIHYFIEEKLIDLIGDVGKKLHTGRSRNDQVGTDIRLWLRKEIDIIDNLIKELQKAFLNICDVYYQKPNKDLQLLRQHQLTLQKNEYQEHLLIEHLMKHNLLIQV